jgi:hypothetical protein
MIAGYSSNDTNLTIPIAAIPELSTAEANTTTGDNREIVHALCEKFYQWYNGLAADKPTKLTISRTSLTNDVTGEVSITYTVNCKCAVAAGALNVESET